MKRIITFILLTILAVGLYVGGVIIYAMGTDYRPSLSEHVACSSAAIDAPIGKDTLNLCIWNIGYGGLGKESDFFHDGGKMVRMPKPIVEKNLAGIQQKITDYANDTDFFLLQEVDSRSKRSHYANQVASLSESLAGYAQASATNYNVRFVPVPLLDPMGSVLSGLSTWSRYQPLKSIRYAFEGNYKWPMYLFYLDRCFLLQRFPTANGRELIIINTHNSAYDDGSLKQRQMRQLRTVLEMEYKLGNYVIAGGDWNQYPATYLGVQGFDAKRGNHKLFVEENYPSQNWQWAYDPQSPTNRSLSAPFQADTTSRSIIDFYLLSPNVELLNVETEEMNFEYSDHHPVRLQIKLKDFVVNQPSDNQVSSENEG